VKRSSRSPATGAARSATRRATDADPALVVDQLRRIERDGGDGILSLPDGATLAVSSLGKVYFPEDGVTKGGLMRYYARMAPSILPQLMGRPLALRRYPSGIHGDYFFQHDPGEHVPDPVRTHLVRVESGLEERRLVGGDPSLHPGQALATLLYTVQLGSIVVNSWHSRVGSLEYPDYTVLDLDPGPDVPFTRVVEVARLVHDQLTRQGLVGVPKTSGSRGLHILVPLPPETSYDVSARLAEEVAGTVAGSHPEIATVERALGDRPAGTVYVDPMQNAYGKTLASVFSARARVGATVSAPLTWRQVAPSLDARRWTITTVPKQRQALTGRWLDQMRATNTRVRSDYAPPSRGR
jgi:bifunctional non-homologous end joining protein LigD